MIALDIYVVIRALFVLFSLIACDLLLCRYYFKMPLTISFFIRVVIANGIGLAIALALEYVNDTLARDVFSDSLVERLHNIILFLTPIILAGSKFAVYGKSLPADHNIKEKIRSLIAVVLSTGIGLIIGVIAIMLIGKKG